MVNLLNNNEGELKKRIYNLADVLKDSTLDNVYMDAVKFFQIRDIIDEAKKDVEDCIEYFDPGDAVGYYIFGQEELAKVLTKWFGTLKHEIY